VNRQSLAPYAMPIAYSIAGVVLVFGMVFLVTRALSREVWGWALR